MTDWLVQAGMTPKDAKYADPQPWEVAAAGGDLYKEEDYENILVALEEGKLSRKQLQINASRLLRAGKG